MDRHTANRVAMARRLANWLETSGPDLDTTINALKIADDDDWARISELAGETHTPSPATRACVIVALTERQRPLAARLLEGLPT